MKDYVDDGDPMEQERRRMRGNRPFFLRQTAIEHYYGDHVRACFFAISAIFAIDIFAITDYTEIALYLLSILILVSVSAITSPRKIWTLGVDIFVSVAGFIATEIMAVNSGEYSLIIIAEVVALLFLTAMYYSIKTARAIMFGQIGGHSVQPLADSEGRNINENINQDSEHIHTLEDLRKWDS